MNIKSILNKHNLTMKKLSESLGVSRPTVNNYIDIYLTEPSRLTEDTVRFFDVLTDPKITNYELIRFVEKSQGRYGIKRRSRLTDGTFEKRMLLCFDCDGIGLNGNNETCTTCHGTGRLLKVHKIEYIPWDEAKQEVLE